MRATVDLTYAIRRLGVDADEMSGDRELLARYTRGRDQEAFAALVRRYGALVLGVARRQAADRHRAEDVFQATFLALARSAAKLGRRPVLANWLYTVALRQARKAQARDARRAALEVVAPPRPANGDDPLDQITGRELLQVIDDELARLPDRLRLPVLLCCVQGHTREEVARLLGWSDGTVKGRLERGRRKLAARLAARGLAPSALLLAPFAAVCVPKELLARCVAQAAEPWAHALPAAVAELARAATPLRLPGVVLAGCIMAAGLVTWAAAASGPKAEKPAPATSPETKAPAFVPDAKPDADDALPFGVAKRFGSTRFRHPTSIETFAVSPDGTTAVATSGTRSFGGVRAYDLATGRVSITLDAPDVEQIAYSPDGKTLATRRFATKGNCAVYLHDAATGKEVRRIPFPTVDAGYVFTYAPDGKRLLIADPGRKALHVLDLANEKVARTFQHTNIIFAGAFSPEGKHVAGAGYDEENKVYFARLWDVETADEVRKFTFGKQGMRSLAFSHDGTTLALGGDYGKPPVVRLYDVATGRQTDTIPFADASSVCSLAFSPDGKTLAASGGAFTRLFDVGTTRERVKIARKVNWLTFSRDGKTLTGVVGGTIDRWDTATGKSLIPEGGDSPVAQLAVSADGKILVSCGYEGDAHVWDARTGKLLRHIDLGRNYRFALSSDGRYLAWLVEDESTKYQDADEPNIIYNGQRLRLLDLTSGEFFDRFHPVKERIAALAFADGKTLLTVDQGRRFATSTVWDVATGKEVRSFAAAGPPKMRVQEARLSADRKVMAVTFHPTDDRLGGLALRTKVKLWDVATGKEIDGPVPHWVYAQTMAFGPDAKTITVATAAGPIQICDAVTGKVRAELQCPHGRATALAYGPDGQLFTGAGEGTVFALGVRETDKK
jgi:RNA polymerase sigma factor (sigma-70 family)